MVRTILRDARFDKRLDALYREGKKAAVVADKAEAIIERIRQQGYVLNDDIGTASKYIENRIRNCVKYDLGNGYRLITVHEENILYLLYVGTHDECHRWVENNRELQTDHVRDRCRPIMVCPAETDAAPTAEDPVPGEDPGDWVSEVDDRILRQVFCGLTGETGPG
jgi:hypothetical protein